MGIWCPCKSVEGEEVREAALLCTVIQGPQFVVLKCPGPERESGRGSTGEVPTGSSAPEVLEPHWPELSHVAAPTCVK